MTQSSEQEGSLGGATKQIGIGIHLHGIQSTVGEKHISGTSNHLNQKSASEGMTEKLRKYIFLSEKDVLHHSLHTQCKEQPRALISEDGN